MNRKQLILLVVVGLVLGGLALYSLKNRQKEFDRRDAGVGEKVLGEFPANDVAQIALKSRESEVNLAKDGVWVVRERSNYPAAFGEISELVRKLLDLKAVQSQKVGKSQWGRLELLAPGAADAGTNTAVLVELRGKDGQLLRSILLGKKQMRDSGGQFGGFPVGRWVAVPGQDESVMLVTEAFSEIEPKVETWLSKDFFKVEKLSSVSLVSTNATNSWSLSRTNETADWTLAETREGENVDKNKLSSFNWAFSSPSFTDVHPKDAPAVADAFAAPTVVHLTTFEGFAYEVKIGSQPDAESFFITVAASGELPKERVAPADESAEDKEKNDKAWKEQQDKLQEKLRKEKGLADWVFKVAKWTVDSVLKDRSALLVEVKPEGGAEAGAGAGAGAPGSGLGPLVMPPLPGVDADDGFPEE